MKVKIAIPDFSFLCLTSSVYQDESESWKNSGDENGERLRKNACIAYCNVELPYPLRCAKVFLNRTDDFYSISLFIGARDASVFRGSSPMLVKGFKYDGLSFFPTSRNGTGYFIDNGVPTTAIYDYDKDARMVALGLHGSCPRRIKDEPDFINSVKECEFISTSFLNTLLSRRSLKREYSLPDDLTIHLMY